MLLRKFEIVLTLFLSTFRLNPPKNIRKPKSEYQRFSDVFKRVKREHWEEKG